MWKFKVGDRVRRINGDPSFLDIGSEYIVTELATSPYSHSRGIHVQGEHDGIYFDEANFDLVAPFKEGGFGAFVQRIENATV